MALFLEIRNGELKGNRTPAKDGMIIGRKRGDLTIRDSKLSTKHARLESRPDGTTWIVDLQSANGIKYGDLRVRELKLEPGTEFVLGRTLFKVVSAEEAEDAQQASEMTVTRNSWDWLRELAERGVREARTSKREVHAFTPVVKMRFSRGLQSGTEWTLGYGPRTVGSASLDLTLEDPNLPSQCFRLEPQHQGVLFKNETDRIVRLNGKWVESELLKDGDVIEIANTRIEIELEPGD